MELVSDVCDSLVGDGGVQSASNYLSGNEHVNGFSQLAGHRNVNNGDVVIDSIGSSDNTGSTSVSVSSCTDVVKHKIDTGDHPPIRQYPRRTPFVQRTKIAYMISDMEKKGIVKPSISPWASPVVLVPKKDGTTRFCIDYRRLNAITKKDVYPLPRIEDILDTIGRAQYFTTSAGYWQIQLDSSATEKQLLLLTVGCSSSTVCHLGCVMRHQLSNG